MWQISHVGSVSIVAKLTTSKIARGRKLVRVMQDLVDEWLRAKGYAGYSKDNIALELGMERATYNKMMKGDPKRLTVTTIEQFAKGLKLTGEDFSRLMVPMIEYFFDKTASFEAKLDSPEKKLKRAQTDINEVTGFFYQQYRGAE